MITLTFLGSGGACRGAYALRRTFYRASVSVAVTLTCSPPPNPQNYNCTSDGAPPLHARVHVHWTDDRLWPGVFCGEKTHVQCEVVFDDGSRLSLPRSRVFGLQERLPKRVASKLQVRWSGADQGVVRGGMMFF